MRIEIVCISTEKRHSRRTYLYLQVYCVYTAYTMYPFYYIRVIYYYYYTVPAYTRYTIYSVGTRAQCGMTVYTL